VGVGEAIAMGVPIVNLITWAVKRIKARRAARKAGHPLPLDPASVQQGVEDAEDIARQIRDARKGR
jgi:hypothetical protein